MLNSSGAVNKQANCVPLEEIKNSIVLVRTAFDIPNLRATARLKDAFATIFALIEQQNLLILASKWGKVNGVQAEWSMRKQVSVLQRLLTKHLKKVQQKPNTKGRLKTLKEVQVVFLDIFDTQQADILRQKIQTFKKGALDSQKIEIFLLENTHFQAAEKAKDQEARKNLAKYYAEFVDYLVDEAFPSSHRQEATNKELKEILPFAYGLSYLQEVQNLNKLKENPVRPLIVIMGGAKLETKLPLITKMLEKADKVLVAGMLAFTFLAAQTNKIASEKKLAFSDSLVETNFLDQAQLLCKQYKEKLVLPKDFLYDADGNPKDVGPETLKIFEEELKQAQSVFWNGPLGKFEEKPFDQGTLALAEFLSRLPCYKVMGGGDTLSAIPSKFLKKFDFVSMGGGATLSFLAQ